MSKYENENYIKKSSFYPAKEIMPGLWIGSAKDAIDASFMKKHDIQLIINCTKEPKCTKFTNIKCYSVPVDDDKDDADTMAKYLPITSLLIADALRYGHNVLVRCWAGMNRSATVVAGYLMFSHYGLSAQDAVKVIKSIKKECYSPMNFWEALYAWEAKLAPRNSRKGPAPYNETVYDGM
jgi:dual specificity MAP kinase phosphatase